LFVGYLGVGDASDILSSDSSGSPSKIKALQQELATLIGTSVDNVDILSVRNAADSPGSVDVTFAAHGSPYYTSEKLSSIASLNRDSVSSCNAVISLQLAVSMCVTQFVARFHELGAASARLMLKGSNDWHQHRCVL
jgi:hypothetical protein